MGIQTTITVTCDYKGCTNGPKGSPAVISWWKEGCESGRVDMPEESKYLVIFNQGGLQKAFCSQLHAAQNFLPPGVDIQKTKITEMPAISQADGHAESPENGLKDCTCQHPEHFHNKWGCVAVMSNAPGDYCRCTAQGPAEGA